jgi:hypothetical protein
MAKVNVIFYCAPNFDAGTEATMRAMQRVNEKYKAQLQSWAAWDTAAFRDAFESVISRGDPKGVYIASHGTSTYVLDDDGKNLLDSANISKLSGRVVYVWSCQAGITLIPDGINKKVAAALAYKGDVSAFIEQNPDGTWDLAEDSEDVFIQPIKSLNEGRTVLEAYQDTVARYDYWIKYWTQQGATAIANVFKANKEIFTYFGNPSEKVYLRPEEIIRQQITEQVATTIIPSILLMFILMMLMSILTAITKE